MKLKIFSLLIIGLLNIAYANNYVIQNIRINGLQRIEMGTVYNYLGVKPGDTMDNNKADDIIRNLYNTGFFSDIRVEEQGNTLIIDLQERPVISKLTVTGDHEFDHTLLIKSLKDNGLADGRIFDQGTLDQAVLSLKSEYFNRGLYSVVIIPKVTQLERNRIMIVMDISEGEPAKIAAINLVGNKKFSQKKLLSDIFLTTGNWLSWWYKDNQYSSDKLGGDIETIRSYYLNRGYIDFKINSVQVQLTPNKKFVYITLSLTEGAQYKVKNVKIAGDIKNVPMEELTPLILVESGQIINQKLLNKTADNIKNQMGNYGYAFANVNPVPEVDIASHTVAFTFFIDSGKKIYVRNINISGNDKTRDVVIRREFRQQEAALYNAQAIKRSKDRLDLLGYFKNTDVATAPVAGISDEVDLNTKVTETNTGSVNAGVGYAQGQGVILNGSISQSNLFGSGKSLALSASTSQLNNSIALSFTDPYFASNGTSLGYDIYDNGYNPNAAGISPYSIQTIGAKIRTGIPVSEYDKINFSFGVEDTQISLAGANVPLRFAQFTNQYGNSVFAAPFSVGWSRNTTDSTLWPTRGSTFNETADITMPGLGPQYYRFTSQNNWFMPISENFTFKTNIQFGFINTYNSDSAVPFYQNYYLGGINSIRGYYINSLGPKDTDGAALGGTRMVVFSNELLFPLPGIKDDHSVRISIFNDWASLWGGTPYDLTATQMIRGSYGVGLTWISPMGPIKLSYALPILSQPNDNLEAFQFQLGSSF